MKGSHAVEQKQIVLNRERWKCERENLGFETIQKIPIMLNRGPSRGASEINWRFS